MAAITRTLPFRRVTAAAIIVLAALSVLTYLYLNWPGRTAYPTFPFSSVSGLACDGQDGVDEPGASHKHAIPNIVHYVWLSSHPPEFSLSFKVFVSVYSAHLFWRPEKIYIHTDATPEAVHEAQVSSHDVWTKRVLSLPGVTPNYIQPPQSTQKGVKIVHLEHKADFIRMAVLRDFGGVYLDTDAVPLRDIVDLRNSGFANVLGGAAALSMKHSGYINNGVMMSVPQSTLMRIYYHAAHEFFDGQWAVASVNVLTDLANRLQPLPSEVLVLQPRAFAPMSWELEDQKRLFLPSLRNVRGEDEAVPGPPTTAATCRDALAWLRRREAAESDPPWELDFSATYVLHAFDDSVGRIRGWDRRVDVPYVMARQSNYARAVYPAIRHAVQAGIISEEETTR